MTLLYRCFVQSSWLLLSKTTQRCLSIHQDSNNQLKRFKSVTKYLLIRINHDILIPSQLDTNYVTIKHSFFNSFLKRGTNLSDTRWHKIPVTVSSWLEKLQRSDAQLSERLASLGIMGAKLMASLKFLRVLQHYRIKGFKESRHLVPHYTERLQYVGQPMIIFFQSRASRYWNIRPWIAMSYCLILFFSSIRLNFICINL